MSLWDDLKHHHEAHAAQPILSLFASGSRAAAFSARLTTDGGGRRHDAVRLFQDRD